MSAKPVVPRARARADVDQAVDYYTNEAGADVAFGFIEALERAYALIGETPAAGSPRWSHELNLPSLKAIRLKGYSWLIFYNEFEAHVEVWRVLHGKRDIPVWLTDAHNE